MRRPWLIPLFAMITGCGDDAPPPVSNAAEAVTAAPIVSNAAIDSPSIENHLEKVPRETGRETPQAEARHIHPDADRYSAIGTEPFWAVTVEGSTVTLERPDKPPLRFAVTRSDDVRAIRYLGAGFTMTLTEGPCGDGMSDAIWSDRVAIAFGEGTLKGCGGLREDMRDDAP
ncbi:membrane-like protein [Sphingobium sp. CR2-8]|uniref:COG3650 family protein n=1 Tax=Sphingobium sp. CR2-8 TaxID=1306534 RepID=UPI002DB72DA5|nr:membrane-like protein [Sphingobium sp. CR2-8]MEC3912891.1 membrane-like protein [Sphingobium sp. CR2-8]